LLVAILASITNAAGAGEFAGLPRSLTKEPKYAHEPRYFLLAFGPEAKTRFWCVFDGDEILYVDRNGNGDLTEQGERFVLDRKANQFLVGDLRENDGKTVYQDVQIWRPSLPHKGRPGAFMVSVKVKGQYRMSTSLDVDAAMARTERAPQIHLGEPLRVYLMNQENLKLVRGTNQYLVITVGTAVSNWRSPTLPRGVGCVEHTSGVPENVHPVAEVTFPPKTPDAKPIVLRTPLVGRC
jgi:hypothetical protein